MADMKDSNESLGQSGDLESTDFQIPYAVNEDRMKFSKHALKRAAQRGIKAETFDLVMSLGEERVRSGGAREYILTNRIASLEIAKRKKEIKAIEKAKNKSFIVTDDLVLTTFHSYKGWKGK